VTTQESLFRYRIQYSKGADIRFISHLDLQRTWERIFRRAALPLAFTEGFHPHPRLNLGLALALGWTSEGELLDIWLTEQFPIEVLRSKLEEAVPESIPILHLTELPLDSPKLQKQIQSAAYRVQVPPELAPEDLEQKAAALLASDSLPRERRGKAYDLRPLLQDLSLDCTGQQPGCILMTLSALPSATGRPDEVLLALGIDPLAADIHRLALNLSD